MFYSSGNFSSFVPPLSLASNSWCLWVKGRATSHSFLFFFFSFLLCCSGNWDAGSCQSLSVGHAKSSKAMFTHWPCSLYAPCILWLHMTVLLLGNLSEGLSSCFPLPEKQPWRLYTKQGQNPASEDEGRQVLGKILWDLDESWCSEVHKALGTSQQPASPPSAAHSPWTSVYCKQQQNSD